MDEPRRTVVAAAPRPVERLAADLAVVGAGAAGVSAAVEAARLGLSVVLLDAQPQIGGQSVNGLLGTFCGWFSAGPPYAHLQYGFAADLLAELHAAGALALRRARGTVIGLYDEWALAAAYARHLQAGGVRVLLGTTLLEVQRQGDRLAGLRAVSRHGEVQVQATTWVDASGDAVLAVLAGLPLQQADLPVWGTVMFTLGGLGAGAPPRDAVVQRLQQTGERHGLARRDGFLFAFPGRDTCIVNLTHIETPLSAEAMSRQTLAAHDEVARVLAFLRAEWPAVFGPARVTGVGQPGVRQTRGIVGTATLTTAAVRAGTRPDDAIARCAWPLEFHATREGVHWETFDHPTWVPLGAQVAAGAANLLAAGRCIDAEPMALAAVRVMGPCMAMGRAAAAAAHAAGAGDLRALPAARVQARVRDNLERNDPLRWPLDA